MLIEKMAESESPVRIDTPREMVCRLKAFLAMKKHANPIASNPARSPAEADRKVMCSGYKRCLDVAVKGRWPGFSCRECGAFKPLEFDPGELLLDSLACIALIHVAESQNTFKQKPRGAIVRRLQHMRSREHC